MKEAISFFGSSHGLFVKRPLMAEKSKLALWPMLKAAAWKKYTRLR